MYWFCWKCKALRLFKKKDNKFVCTVCDEPVVLFGG